MKGRNHRCKMFQPWDFGHPTFIFSQCGVFFWIEERDKRYGTVAFEAQKSTTSFDATKKISESKTRATNRNHWRNQADKPFTPSDNRSGPVDKRSDRPWNNSYRHKGQNSSYFSVSSSSHGSNMPYDLYSVNNVNVMMMYPYDQGACYTSSFEAVEMGSHVHVQMGEVNEITRPREGRHGPQACPDHPSSPRAQSQTCINLTVSTTRRDLVTLRERT